MERCVIIDTLKTYPLELEKYLEYNDDSELVQIAVNKNGMALQYASERLQDDFETVMMAVKKNGASLQFASERLKNNKEIAKQAVMSDGNALEFLPGTLQRDREMVLAASHTCNPELISSEFLADKEVARNLIKRDCTAFKFLDDSLRSDLEFVVKAAGQDSDMLMYVPSEFFENKENVITLVSETAFALQEVPENLKNDKEIALAAMKAVGNGWAYSLLGETLQRDAEIIRTLVDNITFNYSDEYNFIDTFISENIPEELLSDDDFVRHITEIYECSESSISLDKRLVLRMIELQIFNEDLFESEILDDPDVVSAIEQYMS